VVSLWDTVGQFIDRFAPETNANNFTVWYFFNDIYPSTHNGHRPMDPPGWWLRLFERRAALPEDVDSDVHEAALNREVAPPAIADIR
jgi:Derlin-2/3